LLNRFESIIVRFIHDGIQKNNLPKVSGDIKDYKISQVYGVIKGKKEAGFMLVDGIFFTFLGIAWLLGSLPVIYYLIVFGNYSIGANLTLMMFTIMTLVSIVFLIRGGKKLYNYLTCVIEVKNQGETKNE